MESIQQRYIQKLPKGLVNAYANKGTERYPDSGEGKNDSLDWQQLIDYNVKSERGEEVDIQEIGEDQGTEVANRDRINRMAENLKNHDSNGGEDGASKGLEPGEDSGKAPEARSESKESETVPESPEEVTRKLLENLGEIAVTVVDLEQNAEGMVAEKVKRAEAERRSKEANIVRKLMNSRLVEGIYNIGSRIRNGVETDKTFKVDRTARETGILQALKNTAKNSFWAKSYRENRNFTETFKEVEKTGDLLGTVIDGETTKTDGGAVEDGKTKEEKIREIEKTTFERFERAAGLEEGKGREIFLGKNERVREIAPEVKEQIECEYVSLIEKAYKDIQQDMQLGKTENKKRFSLENFKEDLSEIAKNNRALIMKGKIGIDNFANLNDGIVNMVRAMETKNHEISMDVVRDYFKEKMKITTGEGRLGANAKSGSGVGMKATYVLSGVLGAGMAAAVATTGTWWAKREGRKRLGLGTGMIAGVYGAIAGYKNKRDDQIQKMVKEAYGEIEVEKGRVKSMESLIKEMERYGAKENDSIETDEGPAKLTKEGAERLNGNALKAYMEAIARLKAGEKRNYDLLKTERKGIEGYEDSKLALRKAIFEMNQKLSEKDLNKGKEEYTEIERALIREVKTKVAADRMKAIGYGVVRGATTGVGAVVAAHAWRGAAKALLELKSVQDAAGVIAKTGIYKQWVGMMERLSGEEKSEINTVAKELEQKYGTKDVEPNMTMGYKKAGSMAEFLEAQGGMKMNRVGWHDDAVIGDWRVATHGDTPVYEISVWGKGGKGLPDGLRMALTASRETQGTGMMFEVKDGVVRIPVDSNVGQSLFEQNTNGGVSFKGAFTELVEERQGGGMVIHSTDIGSNSVSDMYIGRTGGAAGILKEAVSASPGVGSERTGSNIARIYEQFSNSSSRLAELPEDINLQNGKIDLFSMDKGYNAIYDEALLPKYRSSNVGVNLFKGGATGAEMMEDHLRAIAGSPNLLAQTAAALGIDMDGNGTPDINSLGKIHELTEQMMKDPGAMKNWTNKIYEILGQDLRNGRVEVVGLDNGYTRSTFLTRVGGMFKLGVAKSGFAGSGHGLRMVDAAGNNIIGGQREMLMKAMMGIPAGEEGEFLLRAECGGQLVWVPEKPPIIPTEDFVQPKKDTPPTRPEGSGGGGFTEEPPRNPDDTPKDPPIIPDDTPKDPPIAPDEERNMPKNSEGLIRNHTPGEDTIDRMDVGELTEDPANINKDELIIEEDSGEKGWEGTEEEAGNKFEEEFGGGGGGTTQPTEPIDAPVGSGGDEGGLQPEPTPGEPTQEPDPGELTPEPGTGENGLNEAARATASAGATKVQDLPFFHNYSDEELEALKKLAS